MYTPHEGARPVGSVLLSPPGASVAADLHNIVCFFMYSTTHFDTF
jgi:hypothetical protein